MGTYPTRRRVILAVILVACSALAGWLLYSKLQQTRRDNAYRATLAQFELDVPRGTPRYEVRRFLRAKGLNYYSVHYTGQDEDTDEIVIGEDPSTLVCDWTVYVAFEFTHDDRLSDIHIRKIGTCL